MGKGEENLPYQNMPLCYKDYIELVIFKETTIQKKF